MLSASVVLVMAAMKGKVINDVVDSTNEVTENFSIFQIAYFVGQLKTHQLSCSHHCQTSLVRRKQLQYILTLLDD